MYTIYADNALLYEPMNMTHVVLSPKLTLEMGKAGSLTFSIPKINDSYGTIVKMKTVIVVMEEGQEIFRGRALSSTKDFYNNDLIYCEGDLSFLVDSEQENTAFKGKVKDFLAKVIAAHNKRVESSKRFTLGTVSTSLKDREILVSGKSEDIENAETGDFNYRQIAINATTTEWKKTLDYISDCLIDYCGGYLRTRRVGDITYLDYLDSYGTTSTQSIEFGKNLLNLTDEDSMENLFTVFVPLGNDNLKITSIGDKTYVGIDASGVVEQDNHITHAKDSDELVLECLVKKYGRIMKTHVFDGVTSASTLIANGVRYFRENALPSSELSLTAFDLHNITKGIRKISLGDKVTVKSDPHDISEALTCTKVEYDMQDPEKTVYIFGKPNQTMTQRFKRDVSQSTNNATNSGSNSAGSVTPNYDSGLEAALALLGINIGKLKDIADLLSSKSGKKITLAMLKTAMSELGKDFSIQGLADKLGISASIITEVLSSVGISEGLITDGVDGTITLDSICNMIGFTSSELGTFVQKLNAEGYPWINLAFVKGKLLGLGSGAANLHNLASSLMVAYSDLKKVLDSMGCTNPTAVYELSAETRTEVDLQKAVIESLAGKKDPITGEYLLTDTAGMRAMYTEYGASLSDLASHTYLDDAGNSYTLSSGLQSAISKSTAMSTLFAGKMNDAGEWEFIKDSSGNYPKGFAAIKVAYDKELKEGRVEILADNITLKTGDTLTVAGKIANLDSDITNIKSAYIKEADIETLWSNTFATKSISVDSIVAGSGDFDELVTGPCGVYGTLQVYGKDVATQEWVNGKLANFNIADTTFYKNAISAIKNADVTMSNIVVSNPTTYMLKGTVTLTYEDGGLFDTWDNVFIDGGTICKDAYDSGYASGKSDGNTAGYNNGYSLGYSTGFDKGGQTARVNDTADTTLAYGASKTVTAQYFDEHGTAHLTNSKITITAPADRYTSGYQAGWIAGYKTAAAKVSRSGNTVTYPISTSTYGSTPTDSMTASISGHYDSFTQAKFVYNSTTYSKDGFTNMSLGGVGSYTPAKHSHTSGSIAWD